MTTAAPLLDLPKTGFVRPKQLVRFIPVGMSSLWKMVEQKRFPAPVKLGPATTAFRVEEVRAWIEAQK